MVVKCRSQNFDEPTMGFESFPKVCETPCDQCTEEGDCDWTTADPDDHMIVDGVTVDGTNGATWRVAPLSVVAVSIVTGGILLVL